MKKRTTPPPSNHFHNESFSKDLSTPSKSKSGEIEIFFTTVNHHAKKPAQITSVQVQKGEVDNL
jgi:hypothetical protein